MKLVARLLFLVILIAVVVESNHSKFKNKFKNKHKNKGKGKTMNLNEVKQSAIVKEGWLELGSPLLTDHNRYPELPIGRDNLKQPIRIKGDNTTSAGFVGRDITDPTINDPNYVDPMSLLSPADLAIDFRVNTEYGKKKSVPSATKFFFRLTQKHELYYAEAPDEFQMLGSIAIKNMVSLGSTMVGQFCFTIKDFEVDQWALCGKDEPQNP
jgi:hypothetical protein